MRKINSLLFQVFIVIIACGCAVGSLIPQLQTEDSSPDQPASDFELWTQGILPRISLTCGQENLTNYREQFQMQITGTTEDGMVFDGFDEYLVEFDRTNDQSRELETMQLPDEYLSGTREWVDMDGYTYLVGEAFIQGGMDCEKDEIPADTSHYSDVRVTRILQNITPGALLEEDVLVQGVLANVYEIEDLGLLFVRQLNAISGKVWITRQPMYFIKAEGEIEGVFEFQNRLYNGNATFIYEIKDFDQVQVQLPALCAYPPEDLIPRPENAHDETNHPGLIVFSSPDTVDQVLEFYLAELASQGWQVEEPVSDGIYRSVKASITTQQGVQIAIEMDIAAMSSGSNIQINWQAQD